MTEREKAAPQIISLLREHDSLSPENLTGRFALQRAILFLMSSVKLHEAEYGL